jgi:mRNA interferase MazF
MRRGDIVLVDVPFTDLTSAKMRPAIVVSSDAVNRGEDRVLIPISSSLANPSPWDVVALPSDAAFRATGLHRASAFKCAKMVTLSTSLIKRRLGTADARYLALVSSRIKDALCIR